MCGKSNAVFCPADLIESEIRDNLKVKITTYYGKTKIELLYKGKTISEDIDYY